MRKNLLSVAAITLFLFVGQINAQRTEISIGLSEHFFDTVIDALFQNGEPPEFSIGSTSRSETPTFANASFSSENTYSSPANCRESIRLSREIDGVRSAVRFRDGKILAPMAFNGSYNPPLVGCVDFSGWANSEITLRFDQENQRLVAEAKVQKVTLSGTGGIGSDLIGRMVQNSIDRKINPIEILKLDKVSFMLPVQNSGNLKMKAVGVKPEIVNGVLVVRIEYEFSKG